MTAARGDTPKLCVDCKWYEKKDDETSDSCRHERAQYGGGLDAKCFVRGPVVGRPIFWHCCFAMRAGICGNVAELFEPKESSNVA